MKRQSIVFLIWILFLCSCKKEQSARISTETQLPNYGNIQWDKIFAPEDSNLPNAQSIEAQLNAYYEKVWEQGNLWGGILVAKGEHILLEKYRGFAQENQQEPIDAKTPLHTASVSKPITAMMILKLVEAKKITLDDPITRFFPKFPYPKVTIKHLLNHRSGLPKYEYFIDNIDQKAVELSKSYLSNRDILHLLIKYRPEPSKETDTGFMYCNTNYALLALIIEEITGEKFPEAAQQMVFRPLKMENSYILTEKNMKKAARSFYQKGAKLYPYNKLDLIYGDKNLYTTPQDLYIFSKAMFSEDFLNPNLKEQIFTPYSNEKVGINNYGLGFRMKIFENNKKLIYHNGWWHGSNSVFVHLPEQKISIIALGNKYSRAVYSAMALSGLLADYPQELEALNKALAFPDSKNPKAE